MDEDDLKSAVGYLRCSTDKQEYSIGDQKKVILENAPRFGYNVIEWFIDEGKSGRSVYRRDAFQRLIKTIEKKSNTFTAVLVLDVSRWGRFEDADESAYWEYHCKRHGVDVIYVEEEFRNDTSLETSILKAVRRSSAGEYSKKLSKLTIRGSKTNASLGFFCGGSPPYGYDRLLVTNTGEPVRVLTHGEHKAEKTQRVKLVPGNPQEVSNIKFIFDSYANNKRGLKAIAGLLNEKGISSPRGKKWKSSTIRSILRNEAYCGTRIYYRYDHTERKKTGIGSPKMHDENEWIRKEGAHEPIVSKELLEKVQQQMSIYAKQDIEQRLHSDYLLSGLIKCINCGHNYQGHAHVSRKTSREGKVTVCRTRYYQCGGFMSGGKTVCPGFHIYAPEIEDTVFNTIRETVRESEEIIEGTRKILKAHLSTIYEDNSTELDYIQKALTDIERKLDNIMRGVEQGIDLEIAKKNINRLKNEQYKLQMRKTELESQQDSGIDVDLLCDELVDYIDTFDEMYEKGTITEKKLLIRDSLNKQVEIYPHIPEAALYIEKIPRSARVHQILFPEKKVEVETMAGVGFEPTTFGL